MLDLYFIVGVMVILYLIENFDPENEEGKEEETENEERKVAQFFVELGNIPSSK